jgi:two-component sensor histidine kinase/Tfp pilus assembly protein PilF
MNITKLKVTLIFPILFFNVISAIAFPQSDTSEINRRLQAMANGKLPFDSSLKLIPGIIKQAELINYKKGIASAYLTQGIALYRTGKYNEAIKSYEKSLMYRDTIAEFKEVSRSYNNIALAYANLSLYDKAMYSHNRALKIRQQNKDTVGVAASIMNIGLLYELQGKYDLSQANYFESLKIRETIHDSDGIASCLNNIGTSFFYLNNPKKALEYYSKSSEISIRRNNTLDMGKSYGNLAMVYDHIKNYDQALAYYEKALAMFIELNNPFNIATCYNNIALVYNNLREQDKAIEYHLKSLKIKEQIGDRTGMATSYLNLGNIYLDKKNTKEAMPYFNKGLNLSISSGNKMLMMNAYKGLAELYRQNGDYKSCFTNYQLYELQKDSLNNLEKLAKISELEGLYNTEKKETEILTKDNELKAQLITNEKRKNYLVISGLILLVVILLATQFFLANKKTNVLNKQLLNKISENELLIAEINHRTKNNLQLVSGLLKLPQKEISAESAKEIMSATRDRVNAIGIIHNLLYDRKNTTTIEVKKYMSELCTSLINNLSANNIKINTDIDDVVLDVDTIVPLGLVTNELLTNAIKHAFENVDAPEITINLKSSGNELELLIADNGRKDTTKTLTANGKSFGIKMINLLAAQIQAEFTYYFRNGMNFSFRFKY